MAQISKTGLFKAFSSKSGKMERKEFFASEGEFKEKIGMTPLELSREIRKKTNGKLNGTS